jgi:hypothetical protein
MNIEGDYRKRRGKVNGKSERGEVAKDGKDGNDGSDENRKNRSIFIQAHG